MPILVPQIIVSRSAFESDKPWALMEGNLHFVHKTSADGLYDTDDYLPEAIELCNLWSYLGEVNNGGHEQFVRNSDWKTEINDRIQRILESIGAPEAAALFREVRTRIDSEKGLRDGMKRRGGFHLSEDDKVDAWSREMDRELYELNTKDGLYRLGSEYLRVHPALVVVEYSELETRLFEIASKNPNRAERQAKLDRQKLEQQLKYDRRVRACRLLGEMIGREINTKSGFVVTAHGDAGDVDAFVHGTTDGARVAYIEQGGKAAVCSYPDGKELASIELSRLLD